MHESDVRLLEESFKKYYFDHFDLIHVPEKPALREFGYQKFNSGMTRHLSVKDDKKLHLMIIQNVPSDVYCSNGHYLFPNLPMAEKDWQEADLIFDIDAKDLSLPCRTSHTFHKCGSCNKIYQNCQHCPHCQSAKRESKSLPCMHCIDAAKGEVKKLARILTEDLGVDGESIHVYFSGNEGFHVYVYDTQFQKLGSRERTELANYIMFRGAIPEMFGMGRSHTKRTDFPAIGDGGYRGRLAKEIFGSKSNRSKAITKILGDGHPALARRLQELSPVMGANIDPNVTTDIHRIFRLPGSLNSKSGLAKICCKDLDRFNPYEDACFIDAEEVKIVANIPSKFALGGKKFGPCDNEPLSVPKFAAVYMICKGLASTS